MLRTDTTREEKRQNKKAGCKTILREVRQADGEQGESWAGEQCTDPESALKGELPEFADVGSLV